MYNNIFCLVCCCSFHTHFPVTLNDKSKLGLSTFYCIYGVSTIHNNVAGKGKKKPPMDCEMFYSVGRKGDKTSTIS